MQAAASGGGRLATGVGLLTTKARSGLRVILRLKAPKDRNQGELQKLRKGVFSRGGAEDVEDAEKPRN